MTATTEKFANASIPSVDSDFQLKDVIKTLPQECFQKSPRKAWTTVLLSVLAVCLGYIGIAAAPWFLLPFAWIFAGTALTGFFVIAHDCGHRSFAKQRWVNDWVGHILMLPLIYPFHCWRLKHDHHHIHTNKLHVDNAWEPWTAEIYVGLNPFMKLFYQALRGPFWWLGSIAHWATVHFQPSKFAERDRGKAKVSIAAVVIFGAIFFPTLILTTGLWGFVKFWLLPWLVYHFWMSTFTLVHHTDTQVQFRPVETWNEFEAQLHGTVHCDYPRWVELLCHDINVHIPHHISVAIPSYNLRLAHASIEHNWDSYLVKRKFSWALMKDIVTKCHIYHPEKAYQSFQETESHQPGETLI
ncbi:fatty acid desaturase [Leptolyngbya sp. 'hensonii']|uniref:fatty acid desaturase n=1 Tax=Leptolyngbya sp. 'hensonii' TaxID=1922337 RepID=UPI00094F5E32|nr:fatty acid desaturase [Leptolyngbya sp. 'hensonii']OLP17993.1 fatty acid desaturase [Leptolyngbya sp. 'hensonii']